MSPKAHDVPEWRCPAGPAATDCQKDPEGKPRASRRARLDGVEVSGAELAAWLGGLSDRRVRQLAEAGVIERTRRGRYPLKDSVRKYLRWIDRPREGLDLAEARRRKIAAEAELAELALALRRGELVDAAGVASTWSEGLLAVRERVRGVAAEAMVHCAISREQARSLGMLLDTALGDAADGKTVHA